jgi:predicted adenine nucleotide alpha hydrolase (AANH) superfamily ATPase
MAKVAEFDGIKILFYHDEHPPAHFHARYAEHEAMIELSSLVVLEGSLPRPQLRKVRDWAQERERELAMAWGKCRSDLDPGKII